MRSQRNWMTMLLLVGQALGCSTLQTKRMASLPRWVESSEKLDSKLAYAQLCERHGQAKQARSLYEDLAAQKNPEAVLKAHQRLGVMAAKQGEFAEADHHFKLAAKAGPVSAELLNDIGYNYYLMHRLEEAEVSFREAIKRDPQFVAAHNNLGLTLGQQGQFDDALRAFTRIGDASQAHANMAYVYSQQRNFEQAQTHYLKALSLNDANRTAAEGLAQLATIKPQLASNKPKSLEPRLAEPKSPEPKEPASQILPVNHEVEAKPEFIQPEEHFPGTMVVPLEDNSTKTLTGKNDNRSATEPDAVAVPSSQEMSTWKEPLRTEVAAPFSSRRGSTSSSAKMTSNIEPFTSGQSSKSEPATKSETPRTVRAAAGRPILPAERRLDGVSSEFKPASGAAFQVVIAATSGRQQAPKSDETSPNDNASLPVVTATARQSTEVSSPSRTADKPVVNNLQRSLPSTSAAVIKNPTVVEVTDDSAAKPSVQPVAEQATVTARALPSQSQANSPVKITNRFVESAVAISDEDESQSGVITAGHTIGAEPAATAEMVQKTSYEEVPTNTRSSATSATVASPPAFVPQETLAPIAPIAPAVQPRSTTVKPQAVKPPVIEAVPAVISEPVTVKTSLLKKTAPLSASDKSPSTPSQAGNSYPTTNATQVNFSAPVQNAPTLRSSPNATSVATPLVPPKTYASEILTPSSIGSSIDNRSLYGATGPTFSTIGASSAQSTSTPRSGRPAAFNDAASSSKPLTNTSANSSGNAAPQLAPTTTQAPLTPAQRNIAERFNLMRAPVVPSSSQVEVNSAQSGEAPQSTATKQSEGVTFPATILPTNMQPTIPGAGSSISPPNIATPNITTPKVGPANIVLKPIKLEIIGKPAAPPAPTTTAK